MSRPNEDTLRELYWGEGLSLQQIGERHDMTRQGVAYYMQKYGIPRRTLREARKQYDLPEDELRRLYVDEQRSMSEVAEHYRCHPSVIADRLAEFNIDKRPQGFHSRKRTWEPCVECGDEDGPTDGLPTPRRYDGTRWGFEGELCRRCWHRHYQREQRSD